MAQFPEVDPEVLAQAMRTFITAKMNVNALQNGGAPNYTAVLGGMAEAITYTQNPTNTYLYQSDQAIYAEIQQQQPGGQGSLLFTAASPLSVGQWVYQLSTDTVDLADFSSISTGPVVGVVVGAPTQGTVLIQNLGSFVYNGNMGFGFLPLTPDTIYYLGSSGNITSTPSAPSGGFLQEIGYAKNTYQLVLNIQDPTLV